MGKKMLFFLFEFAFLSITFDFLISFFQKLLLYSNPYLYEVTSQFSHQLTEAIIGV